MADANAQVKINFGIITSNRSVAIAVCTRADWIALPQAKCRFPSQRSSWEMLSPLKISWKDDAGT
jgi:hypothetical protein